MSENNYLLDKLDTTQNNKGDNTEMQAQDQLNFNLEKLINAKIAHSMKKAIYLIVQKIESNFDQKLDLMINEKVESME